ncbi:hypothetical protein [Halomonas ramblicola]|uniref:hypothetical protein n=1 Tax=Halomonas ramblicola TaxID=747349 RepID=UPI0025B54789|nr:hypothetical protein [Halomonas ramblicola]MDN3521528.1 hypothetical protein [Halomonas ramblicola]
MSRPTVLERALRHLLEVESTTGQYASRLLEVGHFNTVVSDLKKRHRIDVRREWRRLINRHGQAYNCKVYWLAPEDRRKAAETLAALEAKRLGLATGKSA